MIIREVRPKRVLLMPRHGRVLPLFLFLLSVLGASPASANAGRPWGGGQIAGELAGTLKAVIAHEDLVIDLRALEESDGLARVRASYDLENRGPVEHLDLVFASGASDLRDLRVTFDGETIATHVDRSLAIPPTWQAPARTPMPDGKGTLPYYLDPRDSAAPVLFAIDLPSGRHQLNVSYSAQAMVHRLGQPTAVQQFAYVLAPARTWDGFGGLDVTVHVPSGWSAAATPALARDGDDLHAKFGDLPADAIAIAVQAPSTRHRIVRVASLTLLALVAIGGAWLIRRRARRRVESGKRQSVLAALGWGAVWSSACFVVGLFANLAPTRVLPSHLDGTSGYGALVGPLLTLLGSAVVFVVGTILYLLPSVGRDDGAASLHGGGRRANR